MCLIKNVGESIYSLELRLSKMNLDALAVKSDFKKGKYSLNNFKFPHITTAISKGKWDLSNWRNELIELSSTYEIDLKIRGKV
jgi:hypothetical protein